MSKRITDTHKEKIKILAGTGLYTIQEIVDYFNYDYSNNQIRTFIKTYAPELREKIKRDSSRGNVKLKSLVSKIFPNIEVQTEYHVGENLRLDVYISEPYNLGFEFDGIQHFKYTPGLHKSEEDFSKGQERDQRKEELCWGRGINLIRIKYDEPLECHYLKDKITSIGYGTGHIKEAYKTNKEKFKIKQDKIKEIQSEKRKQFYQEFKQSDTYKSIKERQKEFRREQYQKRKQWKKDQQSQ